MQPKHAEQWVAAPGAAIARFGFLDGRDERPAMTEVRDGGDARYAQNH